MTEQNIYIVTSYGGLDECYYDSVECAFTNKEDAQKYKEEHEAMLTAIPEEEFNKIKEDLYTQEEKIDAEYYEPYDYCDLKDGASEEEYQKEIDKWYESGRKEYFESHYNYSYEVFKAVEDCVNGYKVGYDITETILRGDTDMEQLKDELDALNMKYLSQVSLYKSLYEETKKKLEKYEHD